MIKKFGNEVLAKLKSIGNAEFLDDRSANPVSAPFWELSFLPIGILLFRFRRFLYLSFVYALLISVLAFATRTAHNCSAEAAVDSFFGCSSSFSVYIAFFMLRLLIVSVFLRVWYKSAVCGAPLDKGEMFVITMRDWKIFGGILIAIAMLCLPILSYYILADRVPNPDWRIESLFFAVVSAGFWLPLVALRFSSIFAFVLDGRQRPPLKLFWNRTAGNTLKILVALSLMMILNAIMFLNYDLFAAFMIKHNLAVGMIVGDLLYNMLFLLMAASFASDSIVQREALFCWYAEEDE